MTKLFIMIAAVATMTGCASYKASGPWTPDSVNYTISRERSTGELTDYFGASWSLK